MDPITSAGSSSSTGFDGVLQSITVLLDICDQDRKHFVRSGRDFHDLTKQLSKLLTLKQAFVTFQQVYMTMNGSLSGSHLSARTQELDRILAQYSTDLNRLTHCPKADGQKNAFMRKLRWSTQDRKVISRAIEILEDCIRVMTLILSFANLTSLTNSISSTSSTANITYISCINTRCILLTCMKTVKRDFK